jgi:signal transduction histidine kinase
MAPGDVAAVIHEAVEMFESDAAVKHITLTAEVKGPSRAVFDHDRVMQVLANLISNAIKFTGERGNVCLRVKPAGDDVQVSIADTGAGIPENMLEAVFRRFWQAVDNDSRGLGLGLYISRSIIEAHGGRIWATSPLGKGSTFIFTLPAAKA